jgi:hypothetical protein
MTESRGGARLVFVPASTRVVGEQTPRVTLTGAPVLDEHAQPILDQLGAAITDGQAAAARGYVLVVAVTRVATVLD